MRLATVLPSVLSCILALGVLPAADDYVWVEGEAAASKSVQPHNWYSEAVKKDQLSGGAWITNFSDKSWKRNHL